MANELDRVRWLIRAYTDIRNQLYKDISQGPVSFGVHLALSSVNSSIVDLRDEEERLTSNVIPFKRAA